MAVAGRHGPRYVRVDGIHLRVRLEQGKVCLLVIIGVRVGGRKELIALADGFGEPTESWASLLRDYKRHGILSKGSACWAGTSRTRTAPSATSRDPSVIRVGRV